MTKRTSKISNQLENSINKLLKEVMTSGEYTLGDKVKVLDRALKLESLKLKEDDSTFGSGFSDDADE